MFFESTSTRFSFASALAWTVLAALFVVAPKAHGQDVSVTIPDTTAVTGDTVSVPVSLSGLDQASDVTAYGFELSFASDSLGYAGFETESTLSAQADFTVSDNPDVPRIGGFGATPLNDVADEGTLLRVQFVILAEGPTQVTLQSLQFNDGSPPASPSQPAFTISGTPPNFPPVGVDDSYETVTNQSLQVDSRSVGVLANDSDPNGDSLSASLGRSPSNGTVTFDSDGTFEYTPDSSFTGEDTFRYGVSDPEAAVDSATVTISVVPPNTPPTITEIDDQTIPEDSTTGPLSFTIGDEETDPSDLSVQATSTTQSLIPDDSISLDGTGENREVVVTPVPNGNGDATVTITVGDGRASTQQEFQVTVQAVNDAPIGKNDQYRVTADDTLQVSDPNRGVLANDSDVENDPLSSFVAEGVSSGSLSLDSTGTFDYVPEAGFTGGDAFTYVVADGRGGRDTATAAITVQPTDSVVVTADSKEAAPGDTVEVPLMVDNLNQAASITSYSFFLQYDETAVGYGGFSTDSTLSEEADFTVEDNPESGQIGAFGGLPLDSIAAEGVLLRLQFVVLEEGTSTIALDSLQFNTGTPPARPSQPQFSVTGDFPNRPPQLSSDQYQVTEGDVLVVEGTGGVLSNDSDPDGDSLTASLLADPTDGSLTFQADGTFEYAPDSAFTGTDSFRYSASDPQGLQDSTSVEILVETDSTVAVDLEDTQGNLNDTLAVPIRLDRLGQVADITSYGFDLTFDSTKVAYAGFEADSTLSEQADFTVNDNPDIPRVGAFGATPLNEQGSQGVMLVLKFQPLVSGTTTIALDQLQFNQGTPAPSPEAPSSTLTVGSANQPTAVADTFSTPKDSTLMVASPGVLENDSDPNGDSLSTSLISNVSNGSLSLGSDGSFEYTPEADFSGEDGFAYAATDPGGFADTASVTINIETGNDPPVAGADSFETVEDSVLTVSAADGLLVNDSDPEGDSLSITGHTDVANGTLSIDADGSLEYVPNPDFNGTDGFRYEAVDPSGAADSASVTITIESVNDAPVAAADSFGTAEDSTLTVEAPGVLENDSDVDGDTLAASVVSGVSNGSLTLGADGSFEYTPDAGFTGTDGFTYAASDGSRADTTTTTIEVFSGEECPLAWSLGVRGSNAAGDSLSVTLGQSSAATAGIDAACGEEGQPPKPPSDVFDLRFTDTDLPGIDLGDGLVRDIRPTGQPTPATPTPEAESAPATWRVEVQSSSYPVTLTWDSAALTDSLPGKPVRLVDVVTGGDIVSVDMKAAGSASIDNSSVTVLEIRLDRALSREMPVASGWNLVSVPLEASDPSFGAVLPICGSGFFFEPGSGYSGIAEGEAVPVGRGLFANCSAGTAEVSGQAPGPTVEVAQGWNIIGPLADSVDVESIASDPAGIVESSFFGFDPASGYTSAETLGPGSGYWVKAAESGTLDLSGSEGGEGSGGAALASKDLASTQSSRKQGGRPGAELRFTDAAGREATLRLTSELTETQRKRGALPPVPPSGALDVRFEGGRSVAEVGDGTLQAIETQGLEVPVTVRLANAEEGQGIQVRHGTEETRLTAESPTVKLSQVEDLAVGLQGTPDEFILKKTYPNPASGRATVEYALPEQAEVTIAVYDVLGRRVATLADGQAEAGRHQVQLDVGRIPSGTYFVRMQAENFWQTRRVTVVR